MTTYPVELTGEQILGFADLVRRLNRAYGPDQDRPLRHDLAEALLAFECLLPEVSDEDGDAYLAKVDAGELPAWGMDPLPATETQAEYEAALFGKANATEGESPATATDAAPAMAETRWDRLARDLNDAGVLVTVDVRPYRGGTSKSITITAGTTLVRVEDTWWPKNIDVWTGWEVHVEGRDDSIVRRTWPRSKKRGETVAAVQAALGTRR